MVHKITFAIYLIYASAGFGQQQQQGNQVQSGRNQAGTNQATQQNAEHLQQGMGAQQQQQYSKNTQQQAPTQNFQGVDNDTIEGLDEMEASAQVIRQFHTVLDELLAELGYDIKLGHLNGLQNIAIRKVDVSSTLPKSYKPYIKLLVSERIRENSETRLINCVPCESKTSRIKNGNLVITSPTTNLAELKSAAEILQIENYMDIILVYHSTHMVLAFQIFRVGTNETVWARSYNSETIRSRFQKLAIDYKQVAKSRISEEYQPEYKVIIGMGGGMVPNVGTEADDNAMLVAHLRSGERFNNRKSEFGLMLNAYLAVNTLLNDYPVLNADETAPAAEAPPASNALEPEPFTAAVGLYGFFANNFFGPVESYNQVRQGMHIGVGGLVAAGYVAGSVRFGWDIYFGRRFVFSTAAVYVAPSTILVNSESVDTEGGVGADAAMSFNF